MTTLLSKHAWCKLKLFDVIRYFYVSFYTPRRSNKKFKYRSVLSNTSPNKKIDFNYYYSCSNVNRSSNGRVKLNDALARLREASSGTGLVNQLEQNDFVCVCVKEVSQQVAASKIASAWSNTTTDDNNKSLKNSRDTIHLSRKIPSKIPNGKLNRLIKARHGDNRSFF